METKHKAQLQRRMKQDSKSWEVMVSNFESKEGIAMQVNTHFNSEKDAIENVLHKIELDLMTALHFGFKNPIQVFIREVK
jgi:hypothetical protein